MKAEAKAERTPIESYLFERFGPLLSGRALWQTLGYNSSQAFRKAAQRGDLAVRTFHIERRRGLFAYSAEVAQWLNSLAHRKCETTMAGKNSDVME